MSQQGTQTPEACPVCREGAFDDSHEAYAGVCVGCGYVIHEGIDPAPPDWLVTADDPNQQEEHDWSSFCCVHDATEQRLAEAFADIEAIADTLPISIELREKASGVYCDAFVAQTTDGRDTSCTVAASVRLASHDADQPIPTNRLTDCLSLSHSAFRSTMTALRGDLDLVLGVPAPIDYLPFLAEDLELTDTHVKAVRELLDEIADAPVLIGKDPCGIAAAAVYLIVNDLTQLEVADAVGVSIETVRQRTGTLRELVQCD